MTYDAWERLAIQAAQWIQEAEARGDGDDAERMRTEIWKSFAQICPIQRKQTHEELGKV